MRTMAKQAVKGGAGSVSALAVALLADHYKEHIGVRAMWSAFVVSGLIFLWAWGIFSRIKKAWNAFWADMPLAENPLAKADKQEIPGPSRPIAPPQPSDHELPQEPPLDVAFVWDWQEDLKRNQEFLGATERNKDILIHNRSDRYIYNVQIRPVELAERLTFDKIAEIQPHERAVPVAHWRTHSNLGEPVVQMFLCEGINESAAEAAGLLEKMTTGLSPVRLRLPMAVDYETRVSRHTSHATFLYDAFHSRFEQFPLIASDHSPEVSSNVAVKPSISAEWKELARQFEKLGDHTRANWQCHRLHNQTIYEAWDFSGDNSAACETFCSYAGRLIAKSPHALERLSENARQQSNPIWKWLHFLKENRGALQLADRIPPTDEKGTIYLMGWITNIAGVSALACTDCAALEL